MRIGKQAIAILYNKAHQSVRYPFAVADSKGVRGGEGGRPPHPISSEFFLKKPPFFRVKRIIDRCVHLR